MVASPAQLGRDPASWDNAGDFEPERFLRSEQRAVGGGQQGSARALSAPRAWLPFGAGPRHCVGKQCALLIATAAVAHLVADAPDGEEEVAM